MQNKCIIYALTDPDTNEIRYVGKSVSGIIRAQKHNMPSHYNNPRLKHFPVYCWIRKLLEEGKKPAIKILEQVEKKKDLSSREINYISELRKICKLLNATDGGEGQVGRIVSEETRQKLRSAHLGRKQNPESIEKMMQTRKQNGWQPPLSSETREKQLISLIKNGHTRQIKDQNENRYVSTRDASRKTGVSVGGIKYSLKSGNLIKGYLFSLLEDGK